MAEISDIRKSDVPEHQSTIVESVKTTEAMHHTERVAAKEREQCERDTEERAEHIEREAQEATGAREKSKKEAKEWTEKAAREFMDDVAKRKAEREGKWKAKREAKERAKQEANERAKREAREEAGRGEGEKAERVAKEKADREVKERDEQNRRLLASIPYTGKNNNCPRKKSGFLQKEEKNEWASSWGFGPTEIKDETPGSPPIVTSSIPGGALDGAGKLDSDSKDSPGAKVARSTW